MVLPVVDAQSFLKYVAVDIKNDPRREVRIHSTSVEIRSISSGFQRGTDSNTSSRSGRISACVIQCAGTDAENLCVDSDSAEATANVFGAKLFDFALAVSRTNNSPAKQNSLIRSQSRSESLQITSKPLPPQPM